MVSPRWAQCYPQFYRLISIVRVQNLFLILFVRASHSNIIIMLTFSMCLPYMISQYTAITSYTLLKRNCNVVDFPLFPNRIHSPLVRVIGNVLLVQYIIMPLSRQIAVNKRHHQTLKSPEKREISVLFQPWSKARSAKSASVIDNVVYPIGMEMLLYTQKVLIVLISLVTCCPNCSLIEFQGWQKSCLVLRIQCPDRLMNIDK